MSRRLLVLGICLRAAHQDKLEIQRKIKICWRAVSLSIRKVRSSYENWAPTKITFRYSNDDIGYGCNHTPISTQNMNTENTIMSNVKIMKWRNWWISKELLTFFGQGCSLVCSSQEKLISWQVSWLSPDFSNLHIPGIWTVSGEEPLFYGVGCIHIHYGHWSKECCSCLVLSFRMTF